MSSIGFTVFKDGKKLETVAKVEYKIIATVKKANLEVLAQWNEPGTYKVCGDPRNESLEELQPANQIKIKERIDEAVDLLKNPTIVHPSFETVPVFVPPPAPMFFQPPLMMKEPPAPPMIFFPPPPFQ